MQLNFFSFLASCLTLGLVACGHAQAPTSTPKLPPGGQVIATQSRLILANGEQFGSVSKVPVTGQPFTEALRIETSGRVQNTWDFQVGLIMDREVRVGEVMLATFAIRAVKGQPETGEAQVMLDFTTTGPDYSKSITQTVNGTRNWRVVNLPFRVLHARPAGRSMLNLRVGYPPQIVEVADFKLTLFPSGVRVEDLPRTRARYAGDEPNAAWRKAANERIERIRKGELNVTVRGPNGRPLPNARVQVEQLTHAFPFGTAIDPPTLLGNTADSQKYREVFQKYFNQAVLENHLKWPFYEEWGREAGLQAVDWMFERGIPLRGHTIIWPGYGNLPKDLPGLKDDPAAIRRRIDARITDIMTATKGKIYEWDVVNEPYSNHDLLDILGADEMAAWFRKAKATDPKPRLTLNDYPPLDGSATTNDHLNHFYRTIARLLELKAPLEAIGFQGHFGSEMIPPARLLTGLDRFSKFGLPIVITEFDMETTDKDLQARYMVDFMTAMFSHPSVVGVTQWGFWEGRHWMPNAALWSRDWKIQPHGQAYVDLMTKTWRTNATVRTGANGQAKTRAFYGNYRVRVTLPNGQVREATVSHTAAKPGRIAIQL